MKVSRIKLGIELSATGLHLFDPTDRSISVEVDQVIFDATRMSGTSAEGYIVSVHGLPQDIAHQLPAEALRALGVGNHFRGALGKGGGSPLPRLVAKVGENKFEKYRQ